MHLPVDFLRSVVALVVVLGVEVFFHEMGHYLAARWRGVQVEAFSIGFGPVLRKWTDRQGTEWRLSLLPLGGYVRMHGMGQPGDVTEEAAEPRILGKTFAEKSVGSRAIIIAAGPVANFLLSIVLFSVLFALAGRPVALPVIGEVMPGSAAAAAGLLSHDRVDMIGSAPIHRFDDLQKIIQENPGKSLNMHILRDGRPMDVPVLVGAQGSDGHPLGVLGVRSGDAVFEKLGPVQAVGAGIAQTWNISVETLVGIWQMVTGHRSVGELGGALRIAQLSGQVAQLGIANLVSFIAVLSINLGLLNLFPIPILDGGHLLFYAAEALRGRPVPLRTQEIGYRIGLAVVGCLFVFTTWNDLGHLGLFRWMARLVG